MNTYKIKIKTIGSKTHLIGYVVVMAKSKECALRMAANEINDATIDCFEEPVLFDSGVVFVTDRSSWEGYH